VGIGSGDPETAGGKTKFKTGRILPEKNFLESISKPEIDEQILDASGTTFVFPPVGIVEFHETRKKFPRTDPPRKKKIPKFGPFFPTFYWKNPVFPGF